jgi:sugar phosphate isomerase/epimerase
VEFVDAGKGTGWDVLQAETDPTMVHFEVDLGWVSAAGLDPVEFLHRTKGRVRWIHVKDLKASTAANTALQMDPTEVGSGRMDWKSILPAAKAAGVQHFYVEQEPPFTMPRIDAAAKSFAYLAALKV